MKTSKQIEKENVVVAFSLPVEMYFKMKFNAEELGYKDMSKYIREVLLEGIFRKEENIEL